MNSVILAMTKCRHKEIKDFLFPGDGLEAAAILVCNQGHGLNYQRLIVADILSLPYERSVRKEDSVTWPFEKHLAPEKITDIDLKGQSIITIHSHPNGSFEFSTIDDETDEFLRGSVRHWFDDGRPIGSALMVPEGRIRGRTIDSSGNFVEMSSISVVGENIEVWKPEREIGKTGYEEKLSQTFGKGTLALLQSLTVGVVGCSGTGSILLELLARNCVGELVIIDDDFVEEKNLNRIINSTHASARRQEPKVKVLKGAIEAMGVGTHVHAFQGVTDQRRVVKALIDCDVIFGAVDSAYGRYHLDCLASAYCIPYFDVGVNIELDREGDIKAADAVSHYVQPDGSSLLSRNAYTMEQVTAENYYRNDREYYERNRIAGYLAEVGEDQPAVMSINMQAACMAFNDLLARIHRYRLDGNVEFSTQRFRMVHGHYECEVDSMKPHPLLKRYAGLGDESILVRNNLIDA